MSYLPLAHVLELVIHVLTLKIFARIGFYSGQFLRLVEDISIFRPTLLVGVGRVFERIEEGIKGKIRKQPFYKRLIFEAAFQIKSFCWTNLRMKHVPGVDLVFNTVRAGFGGRCDLLILGGSPFPVEDQHWLSIVTNAPFVIGYALTETAVSACIQSGKNDMLRGSCGVVLGTVEAKLKSVPELGYHARDFIGEMYLRGVPIFPGYYHNKEETQKAFEDGWFKTGDIMKLSKTGQFSVVGRNKDVVKLQQGEYVSIPKLTAVYQQAPYVNQIYVHAGFYSRFPVAIVVLLEDFPNVTELTKDDVLKDFNLLAEQNHFMGFEKIRALHLTFDQFSPENGTMTPSMKLANHKIQQVYKEVLDELEKTL